MTVVTGRTPFVGREHELALLTAAFDAAAGGPNQHQGARGARQFRRRDDVGHTGVSSPDGTRARSGRTGIDRIVSVRTVERHAVNIYAKIGARGRTDAVVYAVHHHPADAPPG